MIEGNRKRYRPRPGMLIRFMRLLGRFPARYGDPLNYARSGYADLRGYRHDRV